MRPRGRSEILAAGVTAVAAATVVVATLSFLGALSGISQRQSRLAAREPIPATSAAGWWAQQQVHAYRGEQLVVLTVAPPEAGGEGDHPPSMPGVARLPRPGEVLLSPRAQRLRSESPAVGALTPGRSIGAVGLGGLRDADEAYAVVGVARATLTAHPGAGPIGGFGHPQTSFEDVTSATVLSVGATGILVLAGCLLALVATVSGMSGRARARRLSAVVLIGAPPGLVAFVCAAASAATAAVGGVAAAAAMPMLYPGLVRVLGVPVPAPVRERAPGATFGFVVAGLVVASFAIASYRSPSDPWAVRQDAPRRTPSVLRVAPLAFGIPALAVTRLRENQLEPGRGLDDAAALVLLLGVCSCAVGVILAAPLIVAAAARLLRMRAGPIRRCAAARAAHDPWSAARLGALLGVVLMVGGVAIGAMQAAIAPAKQAASRGFGEIALDATVLTPGQREALQGLFASNDLAAFVAMRAVADASSMGSEIVDRPEQMRTDDISYTLVPVPGRADDLVATLVARVGHLDVSITAPMMFAQPPASATAALIAAVLVLACGLGTLTLSLVLLRRQADRVEADRGLLVLGMSRRSLRMVQAWEISATAGPVVLSSCAIATLAAAAVVATDNASLGLDVRPFAVAALGSLGLVATLAAVGAAFTPQLSQWRASRD